MDPSNKRSNTGWARGQDNALTPFDQREKEIYVMVQCGGESRYDEYNEVVVYNIEGGARLNLSADFAQRM